VRYLLEAIRLISKEMPSVRLLVVGYGPLEDPLKSYAQQLGISRNVDFRAPVDQRRLAILMNQSAILALPSLTEGLSNVALEAMACGIPVVATDGIGLNSSLGDAGVFVPAKDPRSLAEAILHLLSDEAIRTKLGRHGRLLVVQRYTWSIVAEAIDQLFSQLIEP